jgi:hypothetical protein
MSLHYVTIRSSEVKGKTGKDFPAHAIKEYGGK